MISGSLKEISRGFQRSFKKFQEDFRSVAVWFQRAFMNITEVFHWSFAVVSGDGRGLGCENFLPGFKKAQNGFRMI